MHDADEREDNRLVYSIHNQKVHYFWEFFLFFLQFLFYYLCGGEKKLIFQFAEEILAHVK